MKLGLIVRADEGGLGTMTWEAARHLRPWAVMIVHVDPERGRYVPSRFDQLAEAYEWRVGYPAQEGDHLRWRAFAAECDVAWTAEIAYNDGLLEATGTKLVVHAMPELWDGGLEPGHAVWAPTTWELDRLPPETPVMPVPVARDRLAPRDLEHSVRVLYHPSAPAMLDRNGSQLLKAALPLCRSRFDLLVSGPERPLEPTKVGSASIWPEPARRDYWRAYDGAEALVLPRRYGGLSLPMQEAASCGLPIVALDTDANAHQLWAPLRVPARVGQSAAMKGGRFRVHTAEAADLAERIDRLVENPEHAAQGRHYSRTWGASLDWASWRAPYLERLENIAAGAFAS